MFDERSYLSLIESADPWQFANLIASASKDEERALRTYLGDEKYRRMRVLALRQSRTRGSEEKKGNVVVIHGIMGADLSSVDRSGSSSELWAKIFAIMQGLLSRLQLKPDGRSELDERFDVRAMGIMKRYYGELLLSLSQRWNVRAFWFDWRKDLKIAAASLESQMRSWFDESEPIHFVAHSMGGLVARTFIKQYPERWEKMKGNNGTGGRLVMLGTPNQGSFAIVQAITGVEPLIHKLALLDTRHSRNELLGIFNTFVGSYQMLPSPLVLPSAGDLYIANTYAGLNIPQKYLDYAKSYHQWLADVIHPERMVYVAGYNQLTLSDIADITKINQPSGYEVTREGDGRVSHRLGLLKGVSAYYVEENHGALPNNKRVITAMDDLLEKGTTTVLSDKPSITAVRSVKAAAEELAAKQNAEKIEFQMLAASISTRSADDRYKKQVSDLERKAEQNLVSGFLDTAKEEDSAEQIPKTLEVQQIAVSLKKGKIQEIHIADDGALPVDVISVGHYLGVAPQNAELAIDAAISAALNGGKEKSNKEQFLLTQYTQRGTIRGELGQPFFLNDPRKESSNRAPSHARLIAISGMGIPGRFGAPELIVLVRELCWSISRLGKQHLASVLIGSGAGNLSIRDAIHGWMEGLRSYLASTPKDQHLKRVTLVEYDPEKIEEIQEAIKSEINEMKNRLSVEFKEYSPGELEEFEREAVNHRLDEVAKKQGRQEPKSPDPTRITVTLEAKRYKFGAITNNASIPEREIPLDPNLVNEANDLLAGEADPKRQMELARYMEKLLVPDDIRRQLTSNAPMVLILDSTTARIHWEVMAHLGDDRKDQQEMDPTECYLGTSRSVTRQLRSTFAPPPEPPPPPAKVLRVLVVADPADNARLPGAEQEGIEVAEIFETFNKIRGGENRVEVVRLIGPQEATRTQVLSKLIADPQGFDVLHYAGHCFYNEDDPAASGWIFSSGVLSANELNRIDRVPRFVFSNACESGVTPDRTDLRSANMAPSFAEAFFQRGVGNFVCTAWPVEDVAARDFARTLYTYLLGLDKNNGIFADMHVAMTKARKQIANGPFGILTWGAYQHYGNPYFRFFVDRPQRAAQPEERKEKPSHTRETAKDADRSVPAHVHSQPGN